MVDKTSRIKSKVLCYGGIVIESIFELPYQPKPGVAHIICEEHCRLGGGAANVAEWLGSWSVPTRLSGNVIGCDHYGDQIWNWLSDYPSIDLQYLKRQDEIRTLIARSIPFPDGNKYLFCSDFASALFVQPTQEMLDDVHLLEIAFYYRNPRGNILSAELAKLAYAKGIKIVAMDVVSTNHETLPLADIIINSAASIIEQHPSVNILEHSKALQNISKGVVITTDGSQKITAFDQDGAFYSLLPPKVQPTDTTGAGDSFRAGIIYGFLEGWPLTRSLRWATAVGALQVQRDFSQAYPPAENIIADLAEQIEVNRNNYSN
jgi:sugar/nucleoside kinase (ribokinase family)